MGFSSITPSISVNTESGQLRTELLNTFSRLDGQLGTVPFRQYVQNGPAGNVGAAETTLMFTSINFNTLNTTGSSFLIFACGRTGANANNKTLNIKFGSSTIFTSGAIALNNKDWMFHGEMIRNGSAAQITYGEFVSNGASPIVAVNLSTESFAVTKTFSLTGTGTATDDITCYYLKLVYIK